MTYSLLGNPLLPSPSSSRSASNPYLDLSRSVKSVSSGSTKWFFRHLSSTRSLRTRIAPFAMTNITKRRQHQQTEPILHYNGPYDTLDQLSDEKMDWIKHTIETNSKSPKMDDFIVFQKSQLCDPTCQPIRPTNSRAMFYLQVLQVVGQNTSKPCSFRCSVQVNHELSWGSYSVSKRCGKSSVQADLNETFLFDVQHPSTATFKVYSKPHSKLDFLGRYEPEQYIGQDTFNITLTPVEKQLRRCTLTNQEQTVQVMVMWGVYVSSRAQLWLKNKQLFAEYLTVYVRGALIPQWQRFWAVLSATQLKLFDFEYKETRAPLHVLSLYSLADAFYPSTEDDERQVDVGPLGLALQFSEGGGDRPRPNFECRMYVLPDSSEAAQRWMEALTNVVSLLTEFHCGGVDSIVPLKFLW